MIRTAPASLDRAAVAAAPVSARIAARMIAGESVREALDNVLGAGTFDRIAAQTYDALRARAAEGR